MTRHLVRLMWNRKRQNLLVALEIFFSFLVLLGVVLLAVQYTNNWRQPLGYTIDRVWSIDVHRHAVSDIDQNKASAVKAQHRETIRQLFSTLRDLPEVEVAAAAFTGPYINATWGSGEDLADGRHVEYGVNVATDEYRDLLSMELVAGRWFTREDDGASWTPVVINERLAREIFGEANPVGREIDFAPPRHAPERPPSPPQRIVGVIRDFRQHGEFSTPGNFEFRRMRLDDPDPEAALPAHILVRVRPGTTAAFEETLVARLQAVARDWSFGVRPLADLREDNHEKYLTPVMAVGTVAVFLLLMVALGLTGVVWQSVTERTREFGLRRAKGATIPNVRRQVLVELTIMTSLALAAGVGLVAQIPLLPLPEDLTAVPLGVFVTSVALSVAAIYLLTLLCGWYPSRLATKIQPAEALHYE